MPIESHDTKWPGVSRREFVLAQFRRFARGLVLGSPDQPKGEALAIVNADAWGGRWIVPCPLEFGGKRCGGVEFASFDDPVHMCCVCWNQANGHQWMTVVFPEAKKEIEFLLIRRPARNQNWLPGESVADVLKENRERGID